MTRTILGAALLAGGVCAALTAQARFDDIIRNLSNPEPRARLDAVRMLREARHPEAIVPLAPLVNDPVDPIQLEAIAAELSFFLVEDVPARRRVGCRRGAQPRHRGRRVRARPPGGLAASGAAGADRGAAQGRRRRERAGAHRGDLRAGDDREAAARRPTPSSADQGARSLRSGDPRRRGPRHRAASGQSRGRRADQGGQRLERRRALRGDASARRCSARSAPSRR